MKYVVITFSIQSSDELMDIARDLLADAAGEIGFEAFEKTKEGIKGYIQTEMFNAEELKNITGQFLIENTTVQYDVEEVADVNWNKTWEDAGFEPVLIAGKVRVYDYNKSQPTAKGNLLSIAIDANQAFGTGNHPTTRMMIETMLELDMNDKTAVDCGCGSGILSIAAIKSGASDVFAFDIDPWSVENTRHNAAINQTENIEVLQGDAELLDSRTGTFDLVMANIHRNIIVRDMERYAKAMKPKHSRLILSGFFLSDAPAVVDEAGKYSLREIGRKSENDWCCLMLG